MVIFSNLIRTGDAQIAQSVEQRTENPRVDGSIPSLGTIPLMVFFKSFNYFPKLEFNKFAVISIILCFSIYFKYFLFINISYHSSGMK